MTPTQPTVEEVAEQIALLHERFLTRPKRSNSFAVYAESNADCKALLALLSALEKDAGRWRALLPLIDKSVEVRVYDKPSHHWMEAGPGDLTETVDTAIDLARGKS